MHASLRNSRWAAGHGGGCAPPHRITHAAQVHAFNQICNLRLWRIQHAVDNKSGCLLIQIARCATCASPCMPGGGLRECDALTTSPGKIGCTTGLPRGICMTRVMTYVPPDKSCFPKNDPLRWPSGEHDSRSLHGVCCSFFVDPPRPWVRTRDLSDTIMML